MSTPNVTKTKKQNNILAIIVMFFLFSMISFVTGMQDPFGVIVRAQFKVSNAVSQLGNMANFIAYACMGLPAGILLKRRGYKVSSLVAVAIGFIGVCLMFISGTLAESHPAVTFGVYLAGAFVSGFSMCMLNSIVNPMLNTLGGGGNKGNQLVQIGGSFNSLNATIIPILVGYLIGTVNQDTQISDANPALFIAMGIFAFAFIVLMLVRIPEPELEAAAQRIKDGDTHSESLGSSIRGALKHKNLIFGMIAIFMYVGMEVSIANVTNLYLTSPGIDVIPAISGTIVGMYWMFMLIGRITGGVIGGKVSTRGMLTTVLSVGILFLVLGMAFGDSSTFNFLYYSKDTGFSTQVIPTGALFFVLCGFCTSVMWGSIFNLAVKGLGEYTSIASGLFMMMVCGGGVLPFIQSYMADKVGFIPSYIVPLIAMVYILWFAVRGSKK